MNGGIMHETTQISYELGTVNIILNSESRIGQDAPNFRFTDYDQVLYSCFTPKELEQIAEGGSAELVLSLASSIAIITVIGAFVAKRTLSSKGQQ